VSSEVAAHADFSQIRYAQCWEDADILLPALNLQPGQVCLSIASAGDNTLSLLSRSPERVIALDLSPAQLACLELRVAAYRELSHAELLVLIGSHPGSNRADLYQRCRSQLSPAVRQFWDGQGDQIDRGIGAAGKFERYFTLFRRYVLPLIHNQQQVRQLLTGGTLKHRQNFYDRVWDTWQWRSLFRIFFSRFVMGRAGRDPSFFKYVEGSVADRILDRTHYALTQLNPAENPYLQWILTGQHEALPHALRLENFEPIRANLDRLEWHCCSVEDFLDRVGENAIDAYNLSDIFEYLSLKNYYHLLERLIRSGRAGGRLAYWNMLAPRSRPEFLSEQLRSLAAIAQLLHAQDKAFFYSAFVVEEIIGC
jgi:S-adenosylmethionine-diacylglycerol 3-amino-3-carboxypropyl transferase